MALPAKALKGPFSATVLPVLPGVLVLLLAADGPAAADASIIAAAVPCGNVLPVLVMLLRVLTMSLAGIVAELEVLLPVYVQGSVRDNLHAMLDARTGWDARLCPLR
jgi:anti-sigma factor RsiW